MPWSEIESWLLVWAGATAGGALLPASWLVWRSRAAILRWWRLRDGYIAPRYPLVLLHGFAGFDELPLGVGGAFGLERNALYFRGLDALLSDHQLQVFRVRVPPFASVERRAVALVEQLEALAAKTGHTRFNLLAHSMGGLDARFAISHLGASARVASLVTVGTPHRGTPIADLMAGLTGKLGLMKALKILGVDADALACLTCERLEIFNREVPDHASVYYGSVVATADSARVSPLLLPAHTLLRRSGKSDGLVPAASQVWGEVLVEAEADHWGQIGWSKHGDPAGVLAAVLLELKARGF